MDKSYQPDAFETRWYAHWEASGSFRPSGTGTPYTIMLPPPNVTGTLHMGHAFQHTLMDALVRYHRMKGFDTHWQMGTDHAGIATEMVVGRQLEAAGTSRAQLGREAFVERVWQWKQESGDTITRQMRRLGTSGDWSRERFTMDAGLSKAVVETFVRLHEEGLVYRGQRLVNWDPVLKTAISDLEVVSTEEDGSLWSIAYPLSDGSGSLVVATTRPETMLGDVAVAVHPEDERYAHLVGRMLRLPLTDREIPVIADDYVERAFGTGCVKITPAHDFNDYAIGQRHDLPLRNIFTPDAALNDSVPTAYVGLDRYEARRRVLADLEAAGALVEVKPHKLMVPRGDRTGQVIEPFLTFQWFVKMDTLAARGLELVESGQVRFVPENWINTYRHWLSNIQDWCISRQLWWGHRIPAWYGEDERIFVGRDEDEARARATQAGYHGPLRRDEDVLETWFSSALWSHSTLGWPVPQDMEQMGFARYLPTSVLVTGFDIIFFWVARMIMMTDHFTGQVPFRDVYITGLVRDKDGQKMSKSKGNVLDPLDLIDGIALEDLVAKRTRGMLQPQLAQKVEKATRKEFPDGIPAFGADALRFTFASLATHGRDIKFDLNRAEGYKNFCNKLWNAARFVLMHCEGFTVPGTRTPSVALRSDPHPTPSPEGKGASSTALPSPEGKGAGGEGPREVATPTAPTPSSDAERWILARLAATTAEVEAQFAAYRFDLVAQALYEFTWNDFCDWFLELAKPVLGTAEAPVPGDAQAAAAHHAQDEGADASAANSMRHTLLHVLESTLRLLHPLVPFVTEEIWHAVAPKLALEGDSISLQPYPAATPQHAQGGDEAVAGIAWLQSVVLQLRRIRSEMNVPPSRSVPLLLAHGGDAAAQAHDRARMQRHEAALRFLARVGSVQWLQPGEDAPAAAAGVVGDLRLLIPLEGLIDTAAEKARLDRELKRVAGEIAKCEGKLGNARFVANAPPEVVEQERARIADWGTQLAALREQRARLD